MLLRLEDIEKRIIFILHMIGFLFIAKIEEVRSQTENHNFRSDFYSRVIKLGRSKRILQLSISFTSINHQSLHFAISIIGT